MTQHDTTAWGSRSDALAPEDQELDLAQRLRLAHRTFPTGVTIVTALGESGPVGLAVNAFTSVSMDPPLVLVCVNTSSRSYPTVERSLRLGISVLSSGQTAVATTFASSGGDKFAEVAWHLGGSGVPLIEDAASTFEIEVESRQVAGTHAMVLGRVTDARVSGRPSLVYSAGAFYDGARLFPPPTSTQRSAAMLLEAWL